MKRLFLSFVLVAVLTVAAGNGASAKSPKSIKPAESCPITTPNRGDPEIGGAVSWYGNDALATNVHMWSEDGTVPVDSDHVMPNGEFGEMKWAWWRFVPGKLVIEGHRLDGAAGPLRADVPEGYGASGFQVSGLIFPTGGCWEVTGRLGDASLTFITFVIPPDQWFLARSFWD